MLLICSCAVASGARTIEEIAEWGRRAAVGLLARMGVRRHLPGRCRATSHPTLTRILAAVDALDTAVGAHLAEHNHGDMQAAAAPGRAIAVDGKALADSAHTVQRHRHLLSAVSHAPATITLASHSLKTLTLAASTGGPAFPCGRQALRVHRRRQESGRKQSRETGYAVTSLDVLQATPLTWRNCQELWMGSHPGCLQHQRVPGIWIGPDIAARCRNWWWSGVLTLLFTGMAVATEATATTGRWWWGGAVGILWPASLFSLEDGEEGGGAGADVVVAAAFGGAGHHRQGGLGPVQGLDLRLSSTQRTSAFSGGSGERPTTSRTLSMNSGSVDSLSLCERCGARANARQILETVDCDIPAVSAIDLVDQWAAFFGVSSSVLTTTRSTSAPVVFRGTPGRGPSHKPSSLRSRKRRRQVR